MYDHDLTNPKLGKELLKELLKDARGELAYEVWLTYVYQHNGDRSEVLSWCVDPEHPDVAPIDPQQAVDQAEPLVSEVIGHLMSDRSEQALEAARRAVGILVHGSSLYQRGCGQRREFGMRHLAVRAWVIRKFNPHPKKPGESSVGFALLADKFFIKDAKCPRKIRDSYGTIVPKKIRKDKQGNEIRYRLCGASAHRHDSECVKALETAVGILKSAMKREGIPT